MSLCGGEFIYDIRGPPNFKRNTREKRINKAFLKDFFFHCVTKIFEKIYNSKPVSYENLQERIK